MVDRRALARLALAHHPDCEHHREDTFRVAGVRVCIGCAFAYPIAALAWLGLATLRPGWDPNAVLLVGLGLVALKSLSALGWTRTRPRKALVALALGLGLGATLHGLVALRLPPASLLLALAGLATLALLLTLPKAMRMARTCGPCLARTAEGLVGADSIRN